MSEPSQPSTAADAVPERFEATVHPGDVRGAGEPLDRLADLDLDRVPDPEGGVRVLADLDTCVRLVREGFEVRLLRPLPLRPLGASMRAGDADVRAWLEDRLRGVPRDEAR